MWGEKNVAVMNSSRSGMVIVPLPRGNLDIWQTVWKQVRLNWLARRPMGRLVCETNLLLLYIAYWLTDWFQMNSGPCLLVFPPSAADMNSYHIFSQSGCVSSSGATDGSLSATALSVARNALADFVLSSPKPAVPPRHRLGKKKKNNNKGLFE